MQTTGTPRRRRLSVEPVGELPGLQTDPHRAWRMLVHDGGNRVGIGTALPAPDDGAGIVDDANGGRLERNVEADIVTLLIHAFLRVTFDTAELTGCAWSAADGLRLRHVPSPAIRVPERAEGGKGPKR